MVWGYPAPNSLSPSGEVQWVPTVRNYESPFWIGNLRHVELRCLVPATAIHAVTAMPEPSDRPTPTLFAMAGIWRDLTDMPVFAIITVDDVATQGKRSTPLILDGLQQKAWLTAEWKDASKLLQPNHSGKLTCA